MKREKLAFQLENLVFLSLRHCSQVHRDFRKPLVIMSPKNLLRHPKVRRCRLNTHQVVDPGFESAWLSTSLKVHPLSNLWLQVSTCTPYSKAVSRLDEFDDEVGEVQA